VRRVLFDENIPRHLRHGLTEFYIRTVQEEEWGAFNDGQLLGRAKGSFDVLLTAERRMEYQQQLTSSGIGIVVLVTPRLRLDLLARVLSDLKTALREVEAGRVKWIRIS
jgi:hypothetical protein